MGKKEEDERLFLSHYCKTLQEIASPPNKQHADVWRLHPDSPLLTGQYEPGPTGLCHIRRSLDSPQIIPIPLLP